MPRIYIWAFITTHAIFHIILCSWETLLSLFSSLIPVVEECFVAYGSYFANSHKYWHHSNWRCETGLYYKHGNLVYNGSLMLIVVIYCKMKIIATNIPALILRCLPSFFSNYINIKATKLSYDYILCTRIFLHLKCYKTRKSLAVNLSCTICPETMFSLSVNEM